MRRGLGAHGRGRVFVGAAAGACAGPGDACVCSPGSPEREKEDRDFSAPRLNILETGLLLFFVPGAPFARRRGVIWPDPRLFYCLGAPATYPRPAGLFRRNCCRFLVPLRARPPAESPAAKATARSGMTFLCNGSRVCAKRLYMVLS